MPKISLIKARKILDSRKKPTLEVLVFVDDFFVKAKVPSGASTGKFEAKVIDVDQAIKNINQIISPALKGKSPENQEEIDKILLSLDGTKNKSKLGGNTLVGVSMAVCRAGAKVKKIPLWKHIQEISGIEKEISLPTPCFNVINGGAHAENDLDIQEFMIVPQLLEFSENFNLAKKIYQKLKRLVLKKYKKIIIGDEGGVSPQISKTREALELLNEATQGFQNFKLILDCAASQFQKGKNYKIDGKVLSKKELLDFYSELISEYPIFALEDPFGEEDFEGWKLARKTLKNVILIGDDLLVTNKERIELAKKENLCNGAIIKINQIGTVSEAIEAIKLAKSFGWKIVVSHRSGETNDDFIADFAVGIGADFIKSGAPAKRERLAKYNRLLKIDQMEKCHTLKMTCKT